jgi:hypothetical protein
MSTYRCPICGANHKDNVSQCRLCGADMTGRPLPVETGMHAPPPVSTKGGVKGLVLIGLGLVLLLIVAAVGLGFVRSQAVETAATKIIGKHTDGWTIQTEPDDKAPGGSTAASGSVGHFSVELPGDRTRETIDFSGPTDGKLVVWTAKIGDDTKLQAGWGTIVPPAPGGGPNGTFADQGPTRQLFLKDLAAKWMTSNGVRSTLVTESNAFFGGLPGYVVKATTPTAKIKDKDAYAQVAFGINGDKLYVLIVTSIYKDADQLDKMMSTFQVLA